MVALENLPRVVVAKGRGGGASDFIEKIHANGKVWGVDESGSVLLDEGTDAIAFFVPTSRADDHIFTGFYAGLDVGEHDMGRGEIDDGINAVQRRGSERGTLRVFFGSRDLAMMSPLTGDVGNQSARFSLS
jgi:hypothetical protein